MSDRHAPDYAHERRMAEKRAARQRQAVLDELTTLDTAGVAQGGDAPVHPAVEALRKKREAEQQRAVEERETKLAPLRAEAAERARQEEAQRAARRDGLLAKVQQDAEADAARLHHNERTAFLRAGGSYEGFG